MVAKRVLPLNIHHKSFIHFKFIRSINEFYFKSNYVNVNFQVSAWRQYFCWWSHIQQSLRLKFLLNTLNVLFSSEKTAMIALILAVGFSGFAISGNV